MQESSREEEPKPRASRLWHYEHETPLHGVLDKNGNEIVVTTAAVYDMDRRVLVVECLTPTGNERTVVDCNVWRGPCGAPGAGAAIRALADFEDCVLASVRAWARVERAKREGS